MEPTANTTSLQELGSLSLHLRQSHLPPWVDHLYLGRNLMSILVPTKRETATDGNTEIIVERDPAEGIEKTAMKILPMERMSYLMPTTSILLTTLLEREVARENSCMNGSPRKEKSIRLSKVRTKKATIIKFTDGSIETENLMRPTTGLTRRTMFISVTDGMMMPDRFTNQSM